MLFRSHPPGDRPERARGPHEPAVPSLRGDHHDRRDRRADDPDPAERARTARYIRPSSLVRAAVQNLSIQDDQARQFILKFGLASDRLDGQVLRAIDSVLDNFASEITKSVKFFQTRYPNAAVSGILLSGFGAMIPQLDSYITTKSGVQSVLANPWQRIQVSQSHQQQLAAVAAEFATAVGLAQRSNNS